MLPIWWWWRCVCVLACCSILSHRTKHETDLYVHFIDIYWTGGRAWMWKKGETGMKRYTFRDVNECMFIYMCIDIDVPTQTPIEWEREIRRPRAVFQYMLKRYHLVLFNAVNLWSQFGICHDCIIFSTSRLRQHNRCHRVLPSLTLYVYVYCVYISHSRSSKPHCTCVVSMPFILTPVDCRLFWV